MQRRFGSDSPRAGEGEGHREAGSDVGSSSGNGISETRRGGRTTEYSAWKRGFRNAWRRGRATSTRWGEGASWSFLSKGNLDPRRSGWKGIFIPFSPIKASRCFEGWTNVRNDTYDVHTYVVGRTCDAHVDATSRIQHQATDGRMEGWMWYQRIHDTEGWMESKDARCAGNTMHVGIERSRRTRQDTTGTSCHPPSTIPCRITCVASDPNVRRSVVCGTSLAPRRIGMRVCCARARAIQRRLDSRLVRTSTELERANRKKPRRGIHDTPHVRCFVTQDRSMPSNGRRRTSTRSDRPQLRTSAETASRHRRGSNGSTQIHSFRRYTGKQPDTSRGASAPFGCN